MDAPELPGYDILGPLGVGGSAEVWRARRRADGLAVALKVVHPARGDVEAALAEAGLLAGVRHPHVVHLYDVLPLPDPEHGRARQVALVTQLAAGGSLAQVLAHRHLLSPGEVVTVLHPVASALAELHRCGVVHGDLSTGNIVFRSDGMPLLADLGTARVVGEEALRGVGTGAADGMVAPEVVEGFPATRESDVYQVGALAWLCLVGAHPGPGFDRRPLAEVAPDLSPVVVDLVQRCVAPQPEDRPDVDEVGAALLEVAAPEPVEVAPDADPAHGVTQRLRQVALSDDAEQPPRRRWWQRSRRDPAPQEERARERRPRGAHRARRGEASTTARDGRAATERAEGGEAEVGRPLVIRGVTGAMALAAVTMLAVVLWPTADPTPAPPARTAPSVVEPDAETDEAEGSRDAAVATGGEAEQDPTSGSPSGVAAQTTGASASDGDAALLGAQVQALLDRRAAAWRASDPTLLEGVVAPGSEAESSETAQLEAAATTGVTYGEVSFDLVELEVLQEHRDALKVEAVIERSPVDVSRGGVVVLQEPAHTDRIRLELARSDDGWLFSAWG